VVATEWQEFRTLDFAEMRRRMRGRAVFDGRNLYRGPEMAAEGFDYFSIGHGDVLASDTQKADALGSKE
jgi:UDPglucose 6-dehydrogenase